MRFTRLYGRNYWSGIAGDEKAYWDAPATNKSLWRSSRDTPRGWYYLCRGLFFRAALPVIIWFLIATVVLAAIGYAGWILLVEVTK